MIIVTLVSTLAASMVWQQWRAVQVESAERARVQAAWILSGALDFGRLILREDQKSPRGKEMTALTEPWATPLAESRLSTFLAADKSNTDDGPEAFLSGSIGDAQALYNVANLVVLKDNKLEVDPLELATLERLCQTVGIETGVATRIARGLRAARDAIASGGTAAAPLMPTSVAQLTWLGVDAASIAALRPYVVVLPVSSPVNVNTASREVLAAVIDGLDVASAERLVQVRQSTPFKTVEKFKEQIPSMTITNAKLSVRSDFFEVRGRLRLADRVLVERSLVQRTDTGQTKVWTRERVASLEQVGG